MPYLAPQSGRGGGNHQLDEDVDLAVVDEIQVAFQPDSRSLEVENLVIKTSCKWLRAL
jgi:hypothetical protein